MMIAVCTLNILCVSNVIHIFSVKSSPKPFVSSTIQPLPHRRLVGNISIFYRYFYGHCSQEIRDIIPVPGSVAGPTETRLIHTLSQFCYLFHELYPTNHNSSLEHTIYGTSCFLLAFLNPITCLLSNLRSINLI